VSAEHARRLRSSRPSHDSFRSSKRHAFTDARSLVVDAGTTRDRPPHCIFIKIRRDSSIRSSGDRRIPPNPRDSNEIHVPRTIIRDKPIHLARADAAPSAAAHECAHAHQRWYAPDVSTASFDLIVIGCGTIGVATALAAARRGLHVLALDAHDIPNTLGEHHGSARLFRSAYFEHPDYVPLLRRAFTLWTEIDRAAATNTDTDINTHTNFNTATISDDRRVFFHTGALYLGPRHGEVLAGTRRSARHHALEIEELSRSDVQTRWPQFDPPPHAHAIFESAAGVMRPEACVAAMARLALAAGAHLHPREPVLAIEPVSTGVLVTTCTSQYRARKAVVAAGPWSAPLLRSLGARNIALSVTRQPMAWLEPKHDAEFRSPRFPCWAYEDTPGSLLYGFPALPGDRDMRIARHVRGEPATADTLDRAVSPSDTDALIRDVRTLLPHAGPLSRAAICMYTYSDDGHFIIDHAPASADIVIACGFSGHGFKFAPVLGEEIAALAFDGRAPAIAFLGLHRFSHPAPEPSA
jgi:sarcosine oxidase